jgi:hypothetical protein
VFCAYFCRYGLGEVLSSLWSPLLGFSGRRWIYYRGLLSSSRRAVLTVVFFSYWRINVVCFALQATNSAEGVVNIRCGK